jgi:hypothetical protein
MRHLGRFAANSHDTHCTGGLVGPSAGMDGYREEKISFPHRGSTPSPQLCGESQINLRTLISIRKKCYEAKYAIVWPSLLRENR